LRLDVDPQFDIFRRLHRGEIPPALSQAFGAERTLAVLPSQAPAAVREGYAKLVRIWQREHGNLEMITDDSLSKLPANRTVWLFGWENRFRPVLNKALAGNAYTADKDSVRLAGDELHRDQNSVVVLARRKNPDCALAWIATDKVAAMPGLARKLPHYGKYSYLGFTGSEPKNIVKGQWPVLNSPMSVLLTEHSTPIKAELAPRKPLVELPPPPIKAQRMMGDIAYLADSKRAGRGLGTPELDQAAQYVASQFQAAGLKPAGDSKGSYYQGWTAQVGEPARVMTLRNVAGVLPGTQPDLPKVVVGAHYDHLGRGWPDVHQGDEGKIHPGANDNASGIAVMLELARVLGPQWHPKRTVVFVAFTGEEAGKLGSAHYVQQLGSSPAS